LTRGLGGRATLRPVRRPSVLVVTLALAAGALGAAGPARGELPLLGDQGATGQGDQPGASRYTNPVLPGDYPDPSVMRDGEDYWAVVTSGGWRPPFTMLHSRDLVNWQVAGSVLRNRPPWTAGRTFWAPEIQKQGGRFLVYYAARALRGNFCVAVASASSPLGFFRDHGPLVCPRLGGIDPQAVVDEGGRPYLVWKVDGNNRHRSTPIVAAPLSADGLRLTGPARELFHNDQPWEGRVVEGPTMVRHEGKLYMLYSARKCCGKRCDYVLGVARSPTLLGRWEKHPGPILEGNSRFRCPGHGTVVDLPNGQEYLVYHAYTGEGSLDVGRQLLLDRIDWGADGWPTVNGGRGPSAAGLSPDGIPQLRRPEPFADGFTGRFLTAGWQWDVARPAMQIDRRLGGRLWLGPVRRGRGPPPGVVGRQPGEAGFVAETVVGGRKGGGLPGIAAYADATHAVGIELSGSRAVVWRTRRGRAVEVASRSIGDARFVPLRIRASAGSAFAFEVGTPGGWAGVGAGRYTAPRWRGRTRVVLRVAGARRARAAFESFSLGPVPGP
jgi:xylan 1,4-beta-xylosidase